MYTTPVKHLNPVAIFVLLLAGVGSFPVLAEVPEGVILETGKPAVTDLIRRILEDPHKGYTAKRDTRSGYTGVSGSYGCNSEALYTGTKELLWKYVESPGEYQSALSDYVLSGSEQCHCTQAIIGQDFDILLDNLGPETSKFRSCDGMHSDPAPGSK